MDFQAEVIENSKKTPVLVDFWASWCAPCRVLGPVLEKLEAEALGAWRLVKIDTEEHPDLAATFRISSIPAVKLFVDGAVVGEFAGALPESAVREFLDQHLPGPQKKILDQAKELVAAGHAAQAQTILEGFLATDPNVFEARLALAELLLENDGQRAEELVAPIPDTHELYEKAESIAVLARLDAKLHDSDLQKQAGFEQYAAGIQHFLQKDYRSALGAWLDVVRQHRQLDDDGARRLSVALFKWLGDDHAVTQEYRRVFASALY